MKKPVPIFTGSKKNVASFVKPDIGLTKNDCICETMAPHCPVHAAKRIPAPGNDVIR